MQIRKSRGEFVETQNYNKEKIAEVIGALESGDYQQGGPMLRNGNKFSLQGVFCDISKTFNWVHRAGSPKISYGYLADIMPLTTQRFFGLSGGNASFVDYLNDEDFTFQMMAQLMKSHFPQVHKVPRPWYFPATRPAPMPAR